MHQARVHIDAVLNLRHNHGHKDGEMTYKQAQLYALAGDKEAALKQLKQSLEQGFFPAQYWQNDPALTSIIDDPRFIELFKQAQQRHRAFAKKFNLTPEF
ncbi:MAG: TPR end-of-group domain-containing protein [Marinicella pacifica]